MWQVFYEHSMSILAFTALASFSPAQQPPLHMASLLRDIQALGVVPITTLHWPCPP